MIFYANNTLCYAWNIFNRVYLRWLYLKMHHLNATLWIYVSFCNTLWHDALWWCQSIRSSDGRQSLYTSRPWGLKPLTWLHKACLKSKWKNKKNPWLEPAVINILVSSRLHRLLCSRTWLEFCLFSTVLRHVHECICISGTL